MPAYMIISNVLVAAAVVLSAAKH